jgi:K+-sensing histidine kinase KdpD
VKVSVDIDDQSNLDIRVKDNGEPPKDTSGVFDPEHSSSAHEPNINDLGIIIGRKLLEMMNGNVVLENGVPRGLESRITMPARPPKG